MNLDEIETALEVMGAMNAWTLEAAFRRYSAVDAASDILEREARPGNAAGWVCSSRFETFGEAGGLTSVLARLVDPEQTPDAREVAALQTMHEPFSEDLLRLLKCLDAVYALWSTIERVLDIDSAVDALEEAGVAREHVALALCAHFGCERERARLPVELRACVAKHYPNSSELRRALAAHLGLRPRRVLQLLVAAPIWSQLPDEVLAVVAAHACSTREHLLHCVLAAVADGDDEELAAHALAFRADARTGVALFLETRITRGREALVSSRANLRRQRLQLRVLERVAAVRSVTRPWYVAPAVPILNTLVVCDHPTYRAICTHEAVRARGLTVAMATWRCDLHPAMHADVVCVQPPFAPTLKRFIFRRIVVLGRAATSWVTLCAGLRSFHRWVFAGLDLTRPKVYPMDPAQSHFLGWTMGQPGVHDATPFVGFDGVGPRLSELPKHVLCVP